MRDGEIQARLQQWREREELTLREVREAVNEHLPEHRRISLGTVANYEKDGDALQDKAPHPAPRSDYLSALKKAFPGLNVGWILTGRGAMYEHEDRRVGQKEQRQWFEEELPRFRLLPKAVKDLFQDTANEVFARSDNAMEQGPEGAVEAARDLMFLIEMPASMLRGEKLSSVARENYLLAMLQVVRSVLPDSRDSRIDLRESPLRAIRGLVDKWGRKDAERELREIIDRWDESRAEEE